MKSLTVCKESDPLLLATEDVIVRGTELGEDKDELATPQVLKKAGSSKRGMYQAEQTGTYLRRSN